MPPLFFENESGVVIVVVVIVANDWDWVEDRNDRRSGLCRDDRDTSAATHLPSSWESNSCVYRRRKGWLSTTAVERVADDKTASVSTRGTSITRPATAVIVVDRNAAYIAITAVAVAVAAFTAITAITAATTTVCAAMSSIQVEFGFLLVPTEEGGRDSNPLFQE